MKWSVFVDKLNSYIDKKERVILTKHDIMVITTHLRHITQHVTLSQTGVRKTKHVFNHRLAIVDHDRHMIFHGLNSLHIVFVVEGICCRWNTSRN